MDLREIQFYLKFNVNSFNQIYGKQIYELLNTLIYRIKIFLNESIIILRIIELNNI